jgi:hypothetical protein
MSVALLFRLSTPRHLVLTNLPVTSSILNTTLRFSCAPTEVVMVDGLVTIDATIAVADGATDAGASKS